MLLGLVLGILALCMSTWVLGKGRGFYFVRRKQLLSQVRLVYHNLIISPVYVRSIHFINDETS